MALKLLNPGLRPLGTFDLDDADAGALTGGEYVALQADAAPGTDGYAADVGSVGPMGPTVGAPELWNFGLASCVAAPHLGGLADEGVADYGTLFGSMIGSNAGRATSTSGAVVIGPSTDRASGKVTVWHQAGLYGVNGAAATGQGTSTTGLDTLTVVNEAIGAETATGLLGSGLSGGAALGVFCGRVADSSLVSTTNAAVGLAAATEYFAVYTFGPSKA